MYLVNDDVIHILSNDDNFVFYYQKNRRKKNWREGKNDELENGVFSQVYD